MKSFSFWIIVFVLLVTESAKGGPIVSFDDLTLFTSTGPTGSYYNGDSGVGSNTNGWTSGGVFFNNAYDNSFGSYWEGWSYSTISNTTTPGPGNQYASWPGGGSNGAGGVVSSGTYAVAFAGNFLTAAPFFNLPVGALLQSVEVANTTYAALSMRNGDAFAKKFGDPPGGRISFALLSQVTMRRI